MSQFLGQSYIFISIIIIRFLCFPVYHILLCQQLSSVDTVCLYYRSLSERTSIRGRVGMGDISIGDQPDTPVGELSAFLQLLTADVYWGDKRKRSYMSTSIQQRTGRRAHCLLFSAGTLSSICRVHCLFEEKAIAAAYQASLDTGLSAVNADYIPSGL